MQSLMDIDVMEGENVGEASVKDPLHANRPSTYQALAPVPAPNVGPMSTDQALQRRREQNANRALWDPNATALEDVDTRREKGMERNVVQFFTKPVWNKNKSRDEGRPIFDAREYISVHAPGVRNETFVGPVRQIDKRIYARQYQEWKSGQTNIDHGTPLVTAGIVSPERAEELAFFKIKTVEQMAALDDAKLQNLGHTARREMEACKAFLDRQSKAVVAGDLEKKLAERDANHADLKAKYAELEAKLAKLSANTDPADAKRKRT